MLVILQLRARNIHKHNSFLVYTDYADQMIWTIKLYIIFIYFWW